MINEVCHVVTLEQIKAELCRLCDIQQGLAKVGFKYYVPADNLIIVFTAKGYAVETWLKFNNLALKDITFGDFSERWLYPAAEAWMNRVEHKEIK